MDAAELVSRALGESDDVVPVIANRPQSSRHRMRPRDAETAKRKRSRLVSTVMGSGVLEAYEDETIFPEETEDLGQNATTQTVPGMQEIEAEDVQPANPYVDSSSGLIAITAALVAPDVTPRATDPVDPFSREKVSSFTARDTYGEPEPSPVDMTGQTKAGAIDAILGRNVQGAKTIVPPGPGTQRMEPNPPVTVESFTRSIQGNEGVQASVDEDGNSVSGIGLSLASAPLPQPKDSTDIKVVMESFRKFGGPA